MIRCLEIAPPFYQTGAMLLSASPAIAGDRAPRGRTIRRQPFRQKNSLDSFQIEAQHLAEAIGGISPL